MFQEITSITRKNYEEGLEYNYWITENNVWWYAYDDIISLIDMSSSKANKFFRYEIPEEKTKYILSFYLHGIIAIIKEWVKNDCYEKIEEIENIIKECVKK